MAYVATAVVQLFPPPAGESCATNQIPPRNLSTNRDHAGRVFSCRVPCGKFTGSGAKFQPSANRSSWANLSGKCW